MCTQYKAQIEKLLIENATLTSQLTAVENRQEMSKTYDVRGVTCAQAKVYKQSCVNSRTHMLV